MMLSLANIQKTINYFRKNGLSDTFLVLQERILCRNKNKYSYELPSEEELEAQRNKKFDRPVKLSLIVPAYETRPIFMQDLILSVMDQTYPYYELIIADASETNVVRTVVKDFQEQYEKIVYVKLVKNGGISENSNEALSYANGEYIGLLDHDDLITPDALYHVAETILAKKENRNTPILLYSDEDKTNTYLEKYYEPNFKPKLNMDLILTNNYICHLSFFKKDVITELGFRKEFDGAQDFDLILRTLSYAEKKYQGEDWQARICHIPRVLYHWRCHEESTAQNPESKRYAYENGRKAVCEYLKEKQIDADVTHLKHLGFYRVEYARDILLSRTDLGIIGGPVYCGKVICGGAMDKTGRVLYEGLRRGFSGYLHRAVLQQSVEAVDIRNIKIREDLIPLFEKVTGEKYPINKVLFTTSEENKKYIKKSILFCNKVRTKNIAILYDPMFLGSEEQS